MTTDADVEFDRSVLGKVIEAGPHEVTRDRIVAFARAVGETNPVYTDDEAARQAGYPSIVAPPTFVNFFVMGSRPDPKIQHGTLSFHSGQNIECYSPVRPGDSLRSRTQLEDVYAKTGRSGTMVFAVWRTDVVNQHDEVVAAVRESFVRR